MLRNLFSVEGLKGMLYIIPAILAAITCHEFAHGFVSYKLGDPTPKRDGRLSLNPLAHLDIVGTLCLLSVMFYRPGNTAADFTLTAMMALLVLSAMCSGPDSGGYLSRLLCRVKIDGRYAYAIYCGHWLINCIVRDHFPGYPFYPALAVYLIVTVAVSVCTTKLIELTTSPLGGGG